MADLAACRNIGRAAIGLVVFGLLALLGTRAGAVELKHWEGASAAPTIELLTAGGTPLSLSSLRGKVVLVNFWATWCEPCVTEMPALQQLRSTFGPHDFEILAVNLQEGPAKINAFVEKSGVSFPIVRDTDGAVAKAWGARVLPASYLIDRDGRIRYTVVGDPDWTSDTLMNTIRTLIAARPAR
ncbi:MAG: peroxiredoxin family protein [Burkholderiaceae bacterium]